MKKRLLLTCLLTGGTMVAHAQQSLIEAEEGHTLLERVTKNSKSILSSNMNLQFYTSVAGHFTDGLLDEAVFKMNSVRLEIQGAFGKDFSYYFRQSYNKDSKPRAFDNLSSSVEYAYVNWQMNQRFTLTVGKQAVQYGGYEYYLNPIRVRQFSEFNDYTPCFLAGVNGGYRLSSTQQFNLQVVNNRNGSDEEAYVYGLPQDLTATRVPMLSTLNWNGFFLDNALNMIYSVSLGELAKKRNILYLTAGNVWKRGKMEAYLDFMYSREGIDSKGLVSELSANRPQGAVTAQHVSYFSTIANFDYRVHPQWNFYIKGAYETSSVYQANGPYEEGLYRRVWNVQACAEYYPLANSELLIFLHLLHKDRILTQRARSLGAQGYSSQRISLGLVYTIPVF